MRNFILLLIFWIVSVLVEVEKVQQGVIHIVSKEGTIFQMLTQLDYWLMCPSDFLFHEFAKLVVQMEPSLHRDDYSALP